LDLKYETGSMRVGSKVIVNVSSLGKLFNQYPTTFHNVVIQGKQIKNASEAKVKKLMKAARGISVDDKLTYKVTLRARSMRFSHKAPARAQYTGDSKEQAEAAYTKAVDQMNTRRGYFVEVALLTINDIGEKNILKTAYFKKTA
jgi:hypothetical protein